MKTTHITSAFMEFITCYLFSTYYSPNPTCIYCATILHKVMCKSEQDIELLSSSLRQ